MYTLIFVILGVGGHETRSDGFASLDACRAQAQLVTGDTRKKVGLVFQSPRGTALAYCRPSALNARL